MVSNSQLNCSSFSVVLNPTEPLTLSRCTLPRMLPVSFTEPFTVSQWQPAVAVQLVALVEPFTFSRCILPAAMLSTFIVPFTASHLSEDRRSAGRAAASPDADLVISIVPFTVESENSSN